MVALDLFNNPQLSPPISQSLPRCPPSVSLMPAADVNPSDKLSYVFFHFMIPSGGVKGYLYPSRGASLNRRMETFSVSHTGNLNDVPVVNVKNHFYNPCRVSLISSTISIGSGRRRQYLITAFFDSTLDINPTLYALEPMVQWRGALAVVSTGSRSVVLSRPAGSQLEIKEVVRLFMRRIKDAMDKELPLPEAITYV
ncbi:hypothetical protein BJ165DRAFT_1532052 [Panaeolus papilionaceus]|nr:hypothetical protein BJ165DRAFT_1532052 [Panaeolus papilionaceus]